MRSRNVHRRSADMLRRVGFAEGQAWTLGVSVAVAVALLLTGLPALRERVAPAATSRSPLVVQESAPITIASSPVDVGGPVVARSPTGSEPAVLPPQTPFAIASAEGQSSPANPTRPSDPAPSPLCDVTAAVDEAAAAIAGASSGAVPAQTLSALVGSAAGCSTSSSSVRLVAMLAQPRDAVPEATAPDTRLAEILQPTLPRDSGTSEAGAALSSPACKAVGELVLLFGLNGHRISPVASSEVAIAISQLAAACFEIL